jgi:hypothetical protein
VDEPPGDRDSGMSIDFTLRIGYRRRRPNTQGDRLEARLDSLGLLLAGAAIAIFLIWIIVPRILDAIGRM